MDKACIFLLGFFYFQSGLGVARGTVRTSWSPRSTPVGCLTTLRPAGGAAPHVEPARPPLFLGRPESSWEVVGKWVCARSRRARPWQTQTMTHQLDERLCRKQQGSGVTAPWKTKCFCLPGEFTFCSPLILGHLQAG